MKSLVSTITLMCAIQAAFSLYPNRHPTSRWSSLSSYSRSSASPTSSTRLVDVLKSTSDPGNTSHATGIELCPVEDPICGDNRGTFDYSVLTSSGVKPTNLTEITSLLKLSIAFAYSYALSQQPAPRDPYILVCGLLGAFLSRLVHSTDNYDESRVFSKQPDTLVPLMRSVRDTRTTSRLGRLYGFIGGWVVSYLVSDGVRDALSRLPMLSILRSTYSPMSGRLSDRLVNLKLLWSVRRAVWIISKAYVRKRSKKAFSTFWRYRNRKTK
mmetsp:Transcript_26736/g.39700  ORF Transcript_26736/g.39700 Transcript_26736/m.39700 type:complete len:269 (+) Transcript_26736:28-834(+)